MLNYQRVPFFCKPVEDLGLGRFTKHDSESVGFTPPFDPTVGTHKLYQIDSTCHVQELKTIEHYVKYIFQTP